MPAVAPPEVADVERRKKVRIRLRRDLIIAPQKYEGRTYYVVKDPVSLRYYRFKEQEHFLINLMDGEATLDLDRVLVRMLRYLSWVFTSWFMVVSVGVMLSAIMLVSTHFETFYEKLPSYHEFFSFSTVGYLWLALGVVKVIHEFGHGLSCKAFGGEVHEMGLLFLVFSPCMYCNVSDSWTLPNKWKRIIISAAGIYVELIIAAIATWVWWNTPTKPFINHLSLSLMVVCSVSTVVFNANPLMRYDGYYV